MKLKKRVAIYIPSTVNVNQTVARETIVAAVDSVAASLSSMFGGATAENTTGFYMSNNGDLVKENITIVYAYTTGHRYRQNKKQVFAICARLKKEFLQECISLEIDRSLQFI